MGVERRTNQGSHEDLLRASRDGCDAPIRDFAARTQSAWWEQRLSDVEGEQAVALHVG